MENVIALPEPIPYRGCQGLRDVRPDTLKSLMELNTELTLHGAVMVLEVLESER